MTAGILSPEKAAQRLQTLVLEQERVTLAKRYHEEVVARLELAKAFHAEHVKYAQDAE